MGHDFFMLKEILEQPQAMQRSLIQDNRFITEVAMDILREEGTPVVTICPHDYTFAETLSNAMEAKSRGAFIIGVSDENSEVYHDWIEIPKVEEIFYPLVSVVPLQLLAYHLAISRGKDPDQPRNLAKSVTVK